MNARILFLLAGFLKIAWSAPPTRLPSQIPDHNAENPIATPAQMEASHVIVVAAKIFKDTTSP